MASEILRIGNVEIRNVRDLPWLRGAPSYMFPEVTPDQWEPHKHWLNPKGNLELNLGSFLIRSGGKTILVDTGIGPREREGFATNRANLIENLAEEGVRPEDVDIVLISHIHVDHVGWNTVDRDDEKVLTFPNAEYWIRRKEYEFFTTHPDWKDRDYIVECILPLQGHPQLRMPEGEERVTEDITYYPAPGHTPDHSGLIIRSGGDLAFLMGDGTHHPVQVTETDWEFTLDIDKKQAIASRRAFVERAAREQAILAAAHYPQPGWGRVFAEGGRHYWKALGDLSP